MRMLTGIQNSSISWKTPRVETMIKKLEAWCFFLGVPW
jgi:hypothetical protein